MLAAMPFTLSEIVPWGRSYKEYLAMFSLSCEDLQGRILGCADGPASFNSVLASKGGAGFKSKVPNTAKNKAILAL
jgi:hypothetical protein